MNSVGSSMWFMFVFLQSNDGEERLAVVRLLAKLFGAKDSELASQNRPLWQCFLGRWVISVSHNAAGKIQ